MGTKERKVTIYYISKEVMNSIFCRTVVLLEATPCVLFISQLFRWAKRNLGLKVMVIWLAVRVKSNSKCWNLINLMSYRCSDFYRNLINLMLHEVYDSYEFYGTKALRTKLMTSWILWLSLWIECRSLYKNQDYILLYYLLL